MQTVQTEHFLLSLLGTSNVGSGSFPCAPFLCTLFMDNDGEEIDYQAWVLQWFAAKLEKFTLFRTVKASIYIFNDT